MSGENYGVSDLFRDNSRISGDSCLLEAGGSVLNGIFGYVISIGVWVLIIGQFLMTACDLLYISLPPIRRLLIGKNAFSEGISRGTGNGSEELKGERAKGMVVKAESGSGKNKIDWSKRCFISTDLVRLYKTNAAIGSKQLIKLYFRRRVAFMVLFVVCLVLLIVSNVFMKTGMNVGAGLLRAVGYVLGISG